MLGMNKLLLILSLLTHAAWSQELPDVRFLLTQRSFGGPFTLPVTVNQQGALSLYGGNATRAISYLPVLQVGYSKLELGYVRPVRHNQFNFYPRRNELGWVDVKLERIEGGAGPAATTGALTLGLSVYRGSLKTTVHHKASKEIPSRSLNLPAKLRDLEAWSVEDSGSYQTYGGISAFVSVAAGIVDVASAAIGVQNHFIVDLRKFSAHSVRLSISEEDLTRRQVTAGPFIASASFAAFRGNRFSVHFDLDLRNSEHHQFYEEALKGNVKLLQKRLAATSQTVTWVGSDRLFFIGLPGLIMQVADSGSVDLRTNGRDTRVDYNNTRTRGVLANHRFHQDFVYQTAEGMVLVWASEMKGAIGEDVERRFLGRARILKVRGFNRTLERTAPFGTVVTQLGIQLTKRELDGLDEQNLDEVTEHLRERCETEWLACDAEPQLRRIVDDFRAQLEKPWAQKRVELGKLFLKEPGLLSAVIKTLGLRKQVYFKFLSETYQSLEGTSPVLP